MGCISKNCHSIHTTNELISNIFGIAHRQNISGTNNRTRVLKISYNGLTMGTSFSFSPMLLSECLTGYFSDICDYKFTWHDYLYIHYYAYKWYVYINIMDVQCILSHIHATGLILGSGPAHERLCTRCRWSIMIQYIEGWKKLPLLGKIQFQRFVKYSVCI